MESAPGGDASGLPEPAAQRGATGENRVDEAVSRLADLAELPVAEHPAIFEHVHQRLTEALGDLDAREQAAPDDGPGQSGQPGQPGS
jgi:hypothetical protein